MIAAALLFCVGLCFSVWTSNSQSIIQLTSPDASARPGARPLPVRLCRAWRRSAACSPASSRTIGGTELALAAAGAAGLAATLWAAARLRGVKLPRRREPLVVEEV